MREDMQLHILRHALGHDQYGPRDARYERNHYCVYRGGGSDVRSEIIALCVRGLLRCGRRCPKSVGGMIYYYVTDAGLAYVEARRERPPKLTRSQMRYLAWLDLDGDISFGDWLKAGGEARGM